MEFHSVTKVFSIFLALGLSLSSKEISQKSAFPSSIHPKEPSQSISQVSQKVTVRIISKYLLGSGVIVSHQKYKYRVLTCAHVLGSKNINEFRLLTSDGQLHLIERDTTLNFDKLDLAIVTFRSEQPYSAIKPAQVKSVSVGSLTYASGFPNYRYRNQNWQDTFTLGVQAFFITSGQVILSLSQPMEEGYQIGLSNDIEGGMSGGPVLNSQGELIAIAGRTKYAPAGIDAYRFANGTQPTKSLLEEMESASWAIPISQSLKVFIN
jgi:serine protease Do